MNARTLIRSSRSIVSCGTSLLISLYQTASSRRAFQTTCLRAVTVHYVKDTRNDKIQRVITTADGRQFTEQENEILHKVFEDIASYSSTTVVNPTENVSKLLKNASLKSVFRNFSNISLHNLQEQQTLEDPKFNTVVNELACAIQEANFDEIACTLASLSLWPPPPKTYFKNFKHVWNSIDRECIKRLNNWSTTQKLLIGDYWFHLRLNRITNYNPQMIKDLTHKCSSLKPCEVVQLMFFVNLQRSVPQNLMAMLEKQVESTVKAVSLKEISVICLGFFKTETQLKNLNVLRYIIRSLTDELEKLDDLTVVGIIKCLRKSFQVHISQYYVPLLHRLAANIHRWNVHAAVHSALLCSATNIFEPFLLESVAKKIKDSLSEVRIKDMFKVVQCLALFNFMPSNNFYEVLCTELLKKERADELWHYPRDIVFIALFFSYQGYYNSNLIRLVLSPEFVKHCFKNSNDVFYVLAVIDYCIGIECSSYTGPRLNKKLLCVLKSHRGNLPVEEGGLSQSPKRNIFCKVTEKVFQVLKDMYGETNVHTRHLLPHIYSPDIAVRLRPCTTASESNFPSLSAVIESHPAEVVVKPPATEVWACVVICGSFAYAYKSDNLCGLLAMKIRQLEKLGYKVIPLSFKEVQVDEALKTVLQRKFKAVESSLFCNASK